MTKALRCSATTPDAHGEHDNLTDGRGLRRHMWKATVEALGVEPATARPVRLVELRGEKASAWDRMWPGTVCVRARGLSRVGESHHDADSCRDHGGTSPPPAFVTVKIN